LKKSEFWRSDKKNKYFKFQQVPLSVFQPLPEILVKSIPWRILQCRDLLYWTSWWPCHFSFQNFTDSTLLYILPCFIHRTHLCNQKYILLITKWLLKWWKWEKK
jgi:hypothetical protein